MKRVPLRIFTLSAVSCVFLGACYDKQPVRPPKDRQFPDFSYKEPESPRAAVRLPWEVWMPFQDLDGARLSNRSLLLGDELVDKGKRRSALEAYLTALSDPLLPREAETAALRISSQYLALDRATKALSTVSNYFKQRGLSEQQVSLPFALILGFAYGRYGDVDQALAWFSRANRQATGKGFGTEVARTGTSLLLRTLPPEKFEDIALNWRSDSFVNELIGRERMRRASRAYDPDDFKADVPFWSSYTDEALKAETMPISPVGTEPRIGVILSLSDRFASLGRDTKQGLDLAVEADKDEPKLSLQVRDVGADTAGASAAVRELVTAGHASVIVGPLLTEAAVSAADTARELNVPLLSFSKSESFRTGGSIFRLGATTSSQIDSLVNAATGEYSLNRFAVVYPRNPNGQEFEQALKKKLGSLGAQLVFEASYAPGDDASMSQAARELEATEADAVLLPDSIDMSARFLSNLSATFRKRVRPLGTALWDNPVKIANSQALFEGAIFVTPFFPQSTRPVVQQFIESYLGKYQASPNFLAAQGFDVGTIVVSALRQSLRDGSSFADSLSRLPPYDGVTGSISFDPSGDIRRTLYIVEVMKDNFLEKLPGAAAVTPPSAQTVTYRGNQRIDAKTNAPVQEPDDTAASGY